MEKETSANRNKFLTNTFAALKHRNFRLFWSGQCVSLIGTWVQNISISWLVLELTNSAFWLGAISAVQFMPIMLFSLYAGTLIDHLDKRKTLIFTQTFLALTALILALDTYFKTVAVWHVFILAFFIGLLNTLDMPTRQSFFVELVGRKDLANAIVLNSSIFNSARIVGPSIAGILIAKVGTDICFFINAISFIPVIAGIIAIEPLKREIYSVKDEDKKGWIVELKEGIFYVKSNPSIYIPLLLLAIVNIVAINFNVIVPLFSKNVFHSGAKGLGFLMSANGIGAVTGAISLAAAGKKRLKPKLLYNATLVLGLSEILMLITKTHLPAYLLLAIAGMSTITLVTTTNSLIQMQVPNHLRGRVMSIYTFVFAGLSPIGNFLTGSMANWTGAPLTIALGGLICLVIGLLFRIKTKNLEVTASLK